MRIMMEKRFWYSTRKDGNILNIYYKLENDILQLFLQTQTKKAGNKRVSVIRTLMKNNQSIVTRRIAPDFFPKFNICWKEADEETIINFLRRGNPDSDAYSFLSIFFGHSIFGLTSLERQYFKDSFPSLPSLLQFYHIIAKECHDSEISYTHRSYGGRPIIITPGKIRKAMMELFKVSPQEVLYSKKYYEESRVGNS